MNFVRECSGLGNRPFPFDRERRRRVMVVLAERDMTISDLARSLNLIRAYISQVICGRDLSPNTEQRIAKFLGKDADYLFPPRTAEEIGKMRKAEAAKKRKAA